MCIICDRLRLADAWHEMICIVLFSSPGRTSGELLSYHGVGMGIGVRMGGRVHKNFKIA